MFGNFQFCANSTRGDYLVFLSSDDWITPNFLKRLVPVLEGDQELASAYGACQLVDHLGIRVGTSGHPFGSQTLKGSKQLRRLLKGTQGALSGTLIRTRHFQSVGGFDETRKIVGDWDLALRLATVGGTAYINEELATYRHWTTPERDGRLATHLEEIATLYSRTCGDLVTRGFLAAGEVNRARARKAASLIVSLGGLEHVRARVDIAMRLSQIHPSPDLQGKIPIALRWRLAAFRTALITKNAIRKLVTRR